MFLHERLARRARRRQYFGTFFFRNRPELEQMRRVAAAKPEGAALHLAILGCSSGAEVYSVLWTIRSARPDLRLHVHAVDYSPEILAVASSAVYTSASSEVVGSSIFERLTEAERQAVFDWDGDRATVKPWLREGIQFRQGDAGDPALARALGPQDIVVASNFLCHMDPAMAQKCLRNIATMVTPGGHLFVLGVDLDVRTTVARELGWRPLPDLIREIHDGDPSVRGDWPFEWWGLEPLNDRRRDWQIRYAVAFQLPGTP
jgi:SAM-dependent methyltransferase